MDSKTRQVLELGQKIASEELKVEDMEVKDLLSVYNLFIEGAEMGAISSSWIPRLRSIRTTIKTKKEAEMGRSVSDEEIGFRSSKEIVLSFDAKLIPRASSEN